MPIYGAAVNLGAPPQRTITRGPREGESVPAYEVRLPGWQDVIHLVPTAMLTPEEARSRQLSQITSLSQSPTPEIARHFAELGTQIDNVQDALVTLSVLGRVASKVAGRSIPGVGAIATAADALNAINIFYPPIPGIHSLPSISHVVEAGKRLRRWPQSKETKRQVGVLAGLASNLYQQRLKDTLRTGVVGFGWGEALQVLQTSDQLLGFGVSLGPIFGAVTDSFFGLLRGSRFDFSNVVNTAVDMGVQTIASLIPGLADSGVTIPSVASLDGGFKVTADWVGILPLLDDSIGAQRGFWEKQLTKDLSPLVKPIDRAVVATLSAMGAAQNAVISAASTVWNAGKWLAGVRGALSWETHVELLVAQILALQGVAPFLKRSEWGELFAPVAAAPVDRPALPFVTAMGVRSPGQLSADLRDGPARFALDWIDEAPTPLAKVWTQSLISLHADLLLGSLEAPGTKIVEKSSPAARALLAMHDVDLLPPFDRSSEQTLQYVNRVADIVEQTESVVPPRALVQKAFLDSFPGGDAT